ncbi:glycosyltransferase family 2 protein [Bacteroides nordii]|uniref:glycosyltransferase family 2 protein n=1 Tax=Bacteroides nordii TaxID=291645 RepID=UPI00203CAA4D|nr:glycosyltransferase family 2 protein [Bacteroides nordii]GFZ42239.1 glycosyl transferase [Bacteroides nordii]
MNNPLVTIGIPFFNGGVYLKYAILSVLNQTYWNWELILINDGSTDNSLDIIANFSDDRIKIINDGMQLGLPTRLNQLSKMANGLFYARMDADDIMHYNRIERQVHYLLTHPDIDVIGTHSYIIDAQNKVVGKSKKQISYPKTVIDILSGGAFIHPSVMGYVRWFREHPYDSQLLRMQDLALWIDTVLDSNFFILPDNLLFYRAVGVPTLSRYLSTQSFFRKYILDIFLRKRTFLAYKLYLLSCIKSLVYLLFSLFKQSDRIIKKRYTSISKEDLDFACKDLFFSITR